MRKKYIGSANTIALVQGKVYEIISVERGWYRIMTESDEDYLFPPIFFVDEDEEGYIDCTPSDYIMEHLVGEIIDK